LARKILTCAIIHAIVAVSLNAASCGREEPVEEDAERTQVVHDSAGLLEYAGSERTYLIHLPPAYDGEHALHMLFAFHGGGGDGEGMMLGRCQRLLRKSDRILSAR